MSVITAKRSASWLAVLVFVTALLSARSIAILLRDLGLSSGLLAQRLLLPAAVATLLYIVVRFWLWALARRGPGSLLLLLAAILGLAAALYPVSQLPTFVGVSDSLKPMLPYGDAVLAVAAMLLLSTGLLRSRLAPPSVAALGGVAAVLFAARMFLSGTALTIVGGLGSLIELAFLVALGVSLLRFSRSDVDEAENHAVT